MPLNIKDLIELQATLKELKENPFVVVTEVERAFRHGRSEYSINEDKFKLKEEALEVIFIFIANRVRKIKKPDRYSRWSESDLKFYNEIKELVPLLLKTTKYRKTFSDFGWDGIKGDSSDRCYCEPPYDNCFCSSEGATKVSLFEIEDVESGLMKESFICNASNPLMFVPQVQEERDQIIRWIRNEVAQ